MSHITEQQLFTTYASNKVFKHMQKKIPGVSLRLLRIQVEEFLKFIVLTSLIKGSPIPVSNDIDEIWHQWILETQEYQKLCEKLPDKCFVHHTSLDENMNVFYSKSPEEKFSLILSWIASYVNNFGSFTNERIPYWTVAYDLMERMHWGIEELNAFAYELIEQSEEVVAHSISCN